MRLPPAKDNMIICTNLFFTFIFRILIKGGHDDESHTDDSQSAWI